MTREKFYSYLQDRKRYSPRTVALYKDALDKFFDCACGDRSSEDTGLLDRKVIRSFVATELDRGLDARSVNLHLSALSTYCNFLIREGVIASNPVSRVPRPKTNKPLPVFYTEHALENYFDLSGRLLEENPEDFAALRSRTILMLLYCSGMRRAELCGLKIANADHGIGNGDVSEAVTVIESIIADAGHGIGDGDVGEAAAVVESIIADVGHGIGDGDICCGCCTSDQIGFGRICVD